MGIFRSMSAQPACVSQTICPFFPDDQGCAGYAVRIHIGVKKSGNSSIILHSYQTSRTSTPKGGKHPIQIALPLALVPMLGIVAYADGVFRPLKLLHFHLLSDFRFCIEGPVAAIHPGIFRDRETPGQPDILGGSGKLHLVFTLLDLPLHVLIHKGHQTG